MSAVVFTILLCAAGYFAYALIQMNMLPDKMLYPLLILTAAVTGLLGIFLLMNRGFTKPRRGMTSRVICVVLALVLAVGMVLGGRTVQKIHETVDKVTEAPVIGAIVDLYVRKDDQVQSLEDAGGYTWGVTDAYDYENTQKALDKVSEQLGYTPKVVKYTSVPEMVDALYDGKIQAFLVNNAYASVLSDLENHSDFTEKTRVLEEFSIESEPVAQENVPQTEPPTPIQDGKKTLTMYLSGSDTRSQVLATSRSDVNIIAAVNLETRQVLLINTPRDYYIPNPAYNGKLDKLTHCGLSGVECSVDALSDLYDEKIDYYAQINFTGFETLIDAVGGITVNSETAFTTSGGVYISQGENSLNGKQALEFARERYSLAQGDLARGNHQMAVIKAVIGKMTSSAVITRFFDIMDSLQGMFATNMPQSEISTIVKMQLDDMSGWSVLSYAVSGTGDSRPTASIPGMNTYVMHPNKEMVAHAQELLDRLAAGEILTEADVAVK